MDNENELNELNPPAMDGYTKIPTFKLWVANRFPYMETDFDALTNYELMTALVDYLNNVIKNEESVESNVAKLNQAYLELFNYVKDYFNNLDVQEEINNKLDELVADGTLTRLIGVYVQPLIDEQNQEISNFKTQVNNQIASQNAQIQAVSSGSPLVASSVAGMTDTSKVYVNTTDGKWYYYNGSAWTVGGTYQSTGIGDGSISYENLDIDLRNKVDSLFTESPNLFNEVNALIDKNVKTWGTPTISNYTYDGNNFVATEVISCNANEDYYLYWFDENGTKHNATINNALYFNGDGTYNSKYEGEQGVANNHITTPEGAKYFALSSNAIKNYLNKTMLTKGEYDGEFMAYGFSIENFADKDEFNELADDVSELQYNVGINKKAHIIFSFDQFVIDNRFTLMKQYNFPFTIALRGQPVTKEEYYEYFIDGDVDFSVYAGRGTKPSDYTQFQEEWNQWVKSLCDEMVEESGLFYPVMYSCADNKTSNILNNVCKNNGFKMCRALDFVKDDGSIEYMNLTRGYLFEGIGNYNYVPLVIYKNGFNLDNIKTQIDNAITQKKSIMLFTHLVKDADDSTITNYDSTTTDFMNVLNYVKQKVDAGLCDVVNARQYYNLYDKHNDIDYKRTNMRNLFDSI